MMKGEGEMSRTKVSEGGRPAGRPRRERHGPVNERATDPPRVTAE